VRWAGTASISQAAQTGEIWEKKTDAVYNFTVQAVRLNSGETGCRYSVHCPADNMRESHPGADTHIQNSNEKKQWHTLQLSNIIVKHERKSYVKAD